MQQLLFGHCIFILIATSNIYLFIILSEIWFLKHWLNNLLLILLYVLNCLINHTL